MIWNSLRLTIVLLLLHMPVSAQETFGHAAIRDIEGLSKRIKVPEKFEQDMVIVRCSAASLPQQESTSYLCFRRDPENDPYHQAIIHAIPRLPVTPATLDGDEVGVWLNFSVVFNHTAGTAEIFPSLLYSAPTEISRYFSAPQRILKHEKPRGCRNRIAWPTIRVDENGQPTVTEDLPAPETKCGRNGLRVLKKSDFLPGVFNGQSIAALYREPFDEYLPKKMDDLWRSGGLAGFVMPGSIAENPPGLPNP